MDSTAWPNGYWRTGLAIVRPWRFFVRNRRVGCKLPVREPEFFGGALLPGLPLSSPRAICGLLFFAVGFLADPPAFPPGITVEGATLDFEGGGKVAKVMSASPLSCHTSGTEPGLPTICQEVGTRFGWTLATGIKPFRKPGEPIREPRPPHRPQAAGYARERPAQATATLTRSGLARR